MTPLCGSYQNSLLNVGSNLIMSIDTSCACHTCLTFAWSTLQRNILTLILLLLVMPGLMHSVMSSTRTKYIEALQHDLVVLGCNVVWIIWSSSLCHEGFANTIATGNQMSWFTDEEGQPTHLPILKLLHDVKSHWDSIYYMINHLRMLKQVYYMWSGTSF